MSTKFTSSYPPFGLRRLEAANYVGLGVTKFDQLVRDGRMPKPVALDAVKVWRRDELESALADLSEEPAMIDNPWDQI